MPLTPQIIAVRYAVVLTALTVLCSMRKAGVYGRGLASTDLAWVLLGATIAVSGCAHGEIESIMTGLWTAICVPIVFGRILPCVLGQQGLPILAVSLVVSGLSYVAYSLLFYPLALPYMGATGNPNEMGLLATGIAVGLISILVAIRGRKQPFIRSVLAIALLASLVLAVASGSRTSCISIVFGSVVAILASCRALLRRPVRLFIYVAVCGIVLWAVLPIIADSGADVMAGLLLKFDKSSKLSGRDDIWSKTWRDMTLIGNGRDYFKDEVGISAHNSTVEMLGSYGPGAALSVVAVALASLHSTFLFYRRNRRRMAHALTPLLLTLSFWTLSCGEAMLGPLGGALNIAFLVATGISATLPGHTSRFCISAQTWGRSKDTRVVFPNLSAESLGYPVDARR